MVETGALHTLTGAARSDESVAGLPQELAGSGPRSDTLGLYIHVPFCAQRCHYCSFNTAPLDDAMLARYLKSLGRELDLLAALPWARRALMLGSRDPMFLFHAGMAARAAGERGLARSRLSGALAANPRFSALYAPQARAALR